MDVARNTTSGTVVRSSMDGVRVGRTATITQRHDRVTVRQQGTIHGEWSRAHARVRVAQTHERVRHTPAWAIVAGILLLPFFLVGIAFFFIKQDEYVPRITATVFIDGHPAVSIERHELALPQLAPVPA